jgi:hypothetical protein
VVKLSCEIIEFGWTKDRALVDTFITQLVAYVCERNGYEEVFLIFLSLLFFAGIPTLFNFALACVVKLFYSRKF